MVDNVPIHGVDTNQSKTLVLLSRPYKDLPNTDKIKYACPLQKVEVDSWDYTSPKKVLSTFEQGKSDAKHYLKQLLG
jgi:hypothetical protein